MGPLKPIREGDLRECLRAADVIRKFQALVDAVREEIKHDWEDQFGRNVGGKKADWGLATGYLPYWWYRPRGWVKRGRHMYLSIGVHAEKGAQDRPCFYVELATDQKKFGRRVEADGKLKGLCEDIGWKWDADGVPEYWGCYKTFPVGTGNIEKIARQQIKKLRSVRVRAEIRKLAKFMEKML